MNIILNNASDAGAQSVTLRNARMVSDGPDYILHRETAMGRITLQFTRALLRDIVIERDRVELFFTERNQYVFGVDYFRGAMTLRQFTEAD